MALWKPLIGGFDFPEEVMLKLSRSLQGKRGGKSAPGRGKSMYKGPVAEEIIVSTKTWKKTRVGEAEREKGSVG